MISTFLTNHPINQETRRLPTIRRKSACISKSAFAALVFFSSSGSGGEVGGSADGGRGAASRLLRLLGKTAPKFPSSSVVVFLSSSSAPFLVKLRVITRPPTAGFDDSSPSAPNNLRFLGCLGLFAVNNSLRGVRKAGLLTSRNFDLVLGN